MKTRSQESSNPANKQLNWKVFVTLMVLSRLAALASIPYIKTLTNSSPQPWSIILLAALLQLVITAALVGFGLWVGSLIGLRTPLLRAILASSMEKRRYLGWLVPSLVVGIAVGIVLELINLVSKRLTPGIPQPPTPPPWQGFFAAFNGAINEELWMRLGVMTILLGVGMLLTQQSRPRSWLVWTANGLAALVYGAAHLRLQATIGPLSPVVVASVFIGNGLAGTVFGWLYWRLGLVTAMVAHWNTDIVLHVVAPALGI